MIDKTELMEYLKTAEGQEAIKPILQSYGDSRATSAIKTFSQNHPTSLNEDELKERLDAIDQANEKREMELKHIKLDSYLYKKCVQNKVDYDFLKDFPFMDEESIDAKVEGFAKVIIQKNTTNINDMIAQNKFIPGGAKQDVKFSRNNVSLKNAIQLEHLGVLDSLSDM